MGMPIMQSEHLSSECSRLRVLLPAPRWSTCNGERPNFLMLYGACRQLCTHLVSYWMASPPPPPHPTHTPFLGGHMKRERMRKSFVGRVTCAANPTASQKRSVIVPHTIVRSAVPNLFMSTASLCTCTLSRNHAYACLARPSSSGGGALSMTVWGLLPRPDWLTQAS